MQKANKETDSKPELCTLLCDVCDTSNHKISVTENDIKVCYQCLKWIEKRAEQEGNLPHIQLNIDTEYMTLNSTREQIKQVY